MVLVVNGTGVDPFLKDPCEGQYGEPAVQRPKCRPIGMDQMSHDDKHLEGNFVDRGYQEFWLLEPACANASVTKPRYRLGTFLPQGSKDLQGFCSLEFRIRGSGALG